MSAQDTLKLAELKHKSLERIPQSVSINKQVLTVRLTNGVGVIGAWGLLLAAPILTTHRQIQTSWFSLTESRTL